MHAVCDYCGEHYPAKRKELGYRSCLDCGDIYAQKEKAFKATCVTISYNKGAYQYITSKDAVKGIFKCGETK